MKSLWILFVTLGLALLSLNTLAQSAMHPKAYNFETFYEVPKKVTPTLLTYTSKELQRHPEFGIKPFNAQCETCVELLSRRTLNTRYYINPNDPSHFYVQQSALPLHFIDEDQQLITIDPYLAPTDDEGIFMASNQPLPMGYDLNSKEAIMKFEDWEFRFNNNLKLAYQSKDGKKTDLGTGNWARTSIGAEGVYTSDLWPKIDLQQEYRRGGVKSTFIIQEPLPLPQEEGWLLFEDHLTLNEGYELIANEMNGVYNGELWQGELVLLGQEGESLIGFQCPSYYDGYAMGMVGHYKVAQSDEGYVVSVAVPNWWLTSKRVKYPLYIDPWVYTRDSIGFFGYVSPGGLPVQGGADLGFSSNGNMGPISCDTTMIMQIPGGSQLFNALIDVEYENNRAVVGCPQPPDTSNFCEFFDVRQEIVGPCSSTGQLTCNPSVPPFLGTCTTDPNKVFGASALRYDNFMRCIPPQCPDYFLPFTLKNTQLQCAEICGFQCAIGRFFAVTVEGRTIELVAEADRYTVCAEEEVLLTSNPSYGVPPYTYVWTPSAQTDSISFVYPTDTTVYIDTAYDQCGNFAIDSVIIDVKPTPEADAGLDTVLCDNGSSIVIGGNPTGPTGASTTWGADPSSATGFLTSTTQQNPTLTIPLGTTGTYSFIVNVVNALCGRYDTVDVTVNPAPQPAIDLTVPVTICSGEDITISSVGAYSEYLWSTGDTTRSIIVTESGNYGLTVRDAAGCEGEVQTQATVAVVDPISFTIQPQSATVDSGESVDLSVTIDLEGVDIQDYAWGPDISITCTQCPNPTVTPIADGYYSLNVVSVDSCVSRDSIFINVILPDPFNIPTAFSPNGDGFNDQFYVIAANEVTVRDFKIFNRWGEKVHDSTLPWDGTYKGEPAGLGVYTYLFVLQTNDGEVKQAGNVTLVK